MANYMVINVRCLNDFLTDFMRFLAVGHQVYLHLLV